MKFYFHCQNKKGIVRNLVYELKSYDDVFKKIQHINNEIGYHVNFVYSDKQFETSENNYIIMDRSIVE